jgi:hypothetical protein
MDTNRITGEQSYAIHHGATVHGTDESYLHLEE